MGKKKGEENPKPSEQKEGHNLLGAPKFKQLENGRFKCVQTGHELLAHSRDAYAESKHCRLGLIDYALARNKPPLNMFEQDPASRSKLICKLTGFSINKSEEHIWKHMNGKRFLNMLDKKEADNEIQNGTMGKQDEVKEKKKKKNENGDLKKKKKKNIDQEEENADEIINGVGDSMSKSSDLEDEADFWMPPVGERWDHDDGGDRWGSDSESGPENDDVGEEDVSDDAGEEGMSDGAGEEDTGAEEAKQAGELSKKTKRMSLEIEPSSFESTKKKKKTGIA